MTDEGKIHAPFTKEQARQLNQYQAAGRMHPFTCPRDHTTHSLVALANGGWICPRVGCDYTQDWAHDFMAEGQDDVEFVGTDAAGARLDELLARPGMAERVAGVLREMVFADELDAYKEHLNELGYPTPDVTIMLIAFHAGWAARERKGDE